MLLGAAGAGATFLAQLPVGNYQALSPNSGEMFTYPPSTCVNWWLGDGRGEVSAQGGGSVTSLPPKKMCFGVISRSVRLHNPLLPQPRHEALVHSPGSSMARAALCSPR